MDQILRFGKFIKFFHSIFALPFALSMGVMALSYTTITTLQFVLIILALITARSSAMAFNRIIDAKIDAKNKRTINREIPAGEISVFHAVTFFILCTVLFLGCTYFLGSHCLILAPVVLLVLLGYSFTKRFTSFSHVVLGIALALAPGGVWYALTAQWSYMPLPLMFGVLFWVAGFDILYSCQDVEFDKKEKLYSIPAFIGVEAAFKVSKLFHLLALLSLFLNGYVFSLGLTYFLFLFIFTFFLIRQHMIITPRDLSRIDSAFFTQNGLASVAFFIGVLVDYFLR